MRLKELREDKDLKQKDLASILNIAQNTYSNYENGKTEPPYEILKKLCFFTVFLPTIFWNYPKDLNIPKDKRFVAKLL